jgi:deoxyribose-phosphate aldolase
VTEAELEQLVAQIAEEILSRVPAPTPAPPANAEGLNIPSLVCPGCTGRCPQTCEKKTREIVAAGACRVSASEKLTRIDHSLASLIDHTILRPDATADDVRKLCAEARKYLFASVCVNPYWVPLVARELRGSPVKVCTVVGFPLGATTTASKCAEAADAIAQGATEVDMVLNVGALKSGDLPTVQADIAAVAATCHRSGAMLKVILETALLTDPQKVAACQASKDAGADFVKTSTGFAKSGATAADVALMRATVGPQIGVKASGGIRSLADLQSMAAAGASRIGASASVQILEQAGQS